VYFSGRHSLAVSNKLSNGSGVLEGKLFAFLKLYSTSAVGLHVCFVPDCLNHQTEKPLCHTLDFL